MPAGRVRGPALDTAPHRFQRSAEVTEPPAVPGQMLLTDGGVYDNMADQWAAGLAGRVRDNAALDIRTTGLTSSSWRTPRPARRGPR